MSLKVSTTKDTSHGGSDEGLMLYTCNCPYESLAGNHPELCHMDMELISRLVGVETERVCHLAAGDQTCAYLIRGADVPA
ncbi:MAG: hypothetical protein ACE5FI_03145 [Anaerolineales bacterium]